jgi:hypothetical protein
VLCLDRKTFPAINLPKNSPLLKIHKILLEIICRYMFGIYHFWYCGSLSDFKTDNLSGEPLEMLCICVRAVVDHSFGISKFRFMGIIICIDINEFSDIVLANAVTVTPDLFNWHIIEHVCFQQRRPLDIYFENWNC